MQVGNLAFRISAVQDTVFIGIFPARLVQQTPGLIQIHRESRIQAFVIHPCAGEEGKVGGLSHADINTVDDFLLVDNTANRFAHFRRHLGSGIVHEKAVQLVCPVAHGDGMHTRFILRTGNGTGENGIHTAVFIVLDHRTGRIGEGEHDLFHLGFLRLPPVLVRFQGKIPARSKAGDHIGTAADRSVFTDLGGRNNREGHFIKNAEIRPFCFDDDRFFILGGN